MVVKPTFRECWACCRLKFHVKHAIASVATGCLHTGMTEHEHVGSEGAQHEPRVANMRWRSQGPNMPLILKLQFAAGWYHEATGGSVPAKDCPEHRPCCAERIYKQRIVCKFALFCAPDRLIDGPGSIGGHLHLVAIVHLEYHGAVDFRQVLCLLLWQ